MGRASAESRGGDSGLEISQPLDVYALDPKTLDPNKHYRWVAQRNYGRRVRQGYGLVFRSKSGVQFLNPELLFVQPSADDLFHKGEAFLMACDKSIYRERRKRIEQIAEQRLSAPKKRFRKNAAKQGVETMSGDQKGEPQE